MANTWNAVVGRAMSQAGRGLVLVLRDGRDKWARQQPTTTPNPIRVLATLVARTLAAAAKARVPDHGSLDWLAVKLAPAVPARKRPCFPRIPPARPVESPRASR